MNKTLKVLDKCIDIIGYIAAIALVLMLLNVAYDVVMRYFFRASSVAMQEMEWHLFTIVFMFGISYALKENAHVRVDMFYDNMKPKKQAFINIFGAILFIIPFSILIIKGGYTYAFEAYSLNEISPDPGGLTHRWIIKSAIAVSFILLIISTISFILHNLQTIIDCKNGIKSHQHKDEVL